METDVLICGAGPSGLMLAIELARRNVAFRLIDKADIPFEGSRGKGLQPRTLEVFDMLGMVDRFVALGGPYPVMRIHAVDGTTREVMPTEYHPPTPTEPFGGPLMLPQFLTERVMRERLAELGHAPTFGAELLGFDQMDGAVEARVVHDGVEQTMRVRYLVGADGGRSTVRQTLDIGFPGETLPVQAIVADVRLDGLTRDAWHRWGGDPARSLAICPLAGTDLYQIQAPVPVDLAPDLSLSGLQALVEERCDGAGIRLRAVSWASNWRCNARLAERYVKGRVILLGDAAHVHPPTGGQGLNTSVQDAWNLGWKLATDLAGGPDMLATYESERREVAAGVLGLSMKLLEAARDQGDMRRDRSTHQLDLGYPDSPLNLDTRIGRQVHAGDRAPDAPYQAVSGLPGRLMHLYGPNWSLFDFGGGERIAARKGLDIFRVGQDIIDEAGAIAEAFDARHGDVVLVRPDGYIGAMIYSRDQLDPYLQRWIST